MLSTIRTHRGLLHSKSEQDQLTKLTEENADLRACVRALVKMLVDHEIIDKAHADTMLSSLAESTDDADDHAPDSSPELEQLARANDRFLK